MFIGRLLGWTFTLAAVAVGVWDIQKWLETGRWNLITAGELWFTLAPESLNIAQAFVQRYLFPELWDAVMQTALLWPAVAVLLVPGILLLMLCRRR